MKPYKGKFSKVHGECKVCRVRDKGPYQTKFVCIKNMIQREKMCEWSLCTMANRYANHNLGKCSYFGTNDDCGNKKLRL